MPDQIIAAAATTAAAAAPVTHRVRAVAPLIASVAIGVTVVVLEEPLVAGLVAFEVVLLSGLNELLLATAALLDVVLALGVVLGVVLDVVLGVVLGAAIDAVIFGERLIAEEVTGGALLVLA